MIKKGFHLTYCTNIHPGESWEETFENLQYHIPVIKQTLSPDGPLGIGLRLSNEASLDLAKAAQLQEFKAWLAENQAYTFTFNGFPYGGFHRQVVKDKVHHPDWTTEDRRDYTLRLFDILNALLPQDMDGGISTSPLSYKFWHNGAEKLDEARRISTLHMVEVAVKLYQIRESEGRLLHLDIEPEPDGLLENTADVLDFYRNWLLPLGTGVFVKEFDLSEEEAVLALKEHIRICYDVCHFAVVYEKPGEVFTAFEAEGIKIGKIQISAALKVNLPQDPAERDVVRSLLLPFEESTYLHQVVARHQDGSLIAYNDLSPALDTLANADAEEWRIHFHVPVFLAEYGQLSSTQEAILDVLKILRSQKVTNHLEVETYTWEVLPEDVNLDLSHSIIRELEWVTEKME
jgi:hypothetical protein